jgi:hypothetical protein
MKKTLGTLALMAVSAAAFVMPAAAADRFDRNNSYQPQVVHEQVAPYRGYRDDDRKPVVVVRRDRREPVRPVIRYQVTRECR